MDHELQEMGFVTSGVEATRVFAACILEKFSYSLQWVIGAAGRLGSAKSYEARVRTQNSLILTDTKSFL